MFFTNVYASTSFVHASATNGKYEVFVWLVYAYADFFSSHGTNHSSGFYSIPEFILITQKNRQT